MKRAQLLAHLQVAGYHGDRASFTQLLIEHRISSATATEAFQIGVRAREAGIPCGCANCKSSTTPSL